MASLPPYPPSAIHHCYIENKQGDRKLEQPIRSSRFDGPKRIIKQCRGVAIWAALASSRQISSLGDTQMRRVTHRTVTCWQKMPLAGSETEFLCSVCSLNMFVSALRRLRWNLFQLQCHLSSCPLRLYSPLVYTGAQPRSVRRAFLTWYLETRGGIQAVKMTVILFWRILICWTWSYKHVEAW
jgi:hypothetical protein